MTWLSLPIYLLDRVFFRRIRAFFSGGATNPEINGLPVLSDGVFSLVIVSSNAGAFVSALVGGSLTKF